MSQRQHIGKRIRVKMPDGKLWKLGTSGEGIKGQHGTVLDVEKKYSQSRGWTDTYDMYFKVKLDDGQVSTFQRQALYLPR